MFNLMGLQDQPQQERVEYVYANNVLISVNPIEAKFRFVLMTGGGTKIVAKVMMSPLFLHALREYADDLIQSYEEKYGPFPSVPEDNPDLIKNFFGQPMPEGSDEQPE